VSGRIVPFTKNRQVIYDLLTRAKRYHCPVTSTIRFEVDALEAARRATKVDGKPVGLTAVMVKATALVLKAHPRFNHHMFHGLFGKYEVAFERIRCNMIVLKRGPDGERILLPLIVEDADQKSVVEIQQAIDAVRRAPLEELPQFQAIERVKKLPRLALRWFSYKVRSDHRYYARYFGTYGLSSMTSKRANAHALHTVANTAAAFLFGSVVSAPVVRGGEVVPGKVLDVALVADHYVLDGIDMVEGVRTLRGLLERPERLGLNTPEPEA
jgi:pyruvate/2-oxoglutarate dehydrogenase complex dihydrolipoamide acyltransferase (E2) component